MGYIIGKKGSKFYAAGFGDHEEYFHDKDWEELVRKMSQSVEVMDAFRYGEVIFSKETNHSTFLEIVDEDIQAAISSRLQQISMKESVFSEADFDE